MSRPSPARRARAASSATRAQPTGRRPHTRPNRGRPLDRDQAAFLAARLEEASRADPRWRTLARELLKLGGRALVVPPDLEPPCAMDALLDGALLWARAGASRAPVTMPKLAPAVAARWRHGKRRSQVARGFALDDDGLWRSHVWLVRQGRAAELGERRVRYFGVVLGDEEAERWSGQVLGVDAASSEDAAIA